jgi:hypothetical protein
MIFTTSPYLHLFKLNSTYKYEEKSSERLDLKESKIFEICIEKENQNDRKYDFL